ncbi:MAG: biotin/lipoyl-binding protein [Gammaproteobacteria bacterium]|nr:biotin/lipoyl-binding protein [Gammaproteobacteria bacterium]
MKRLLASVGALALLLVIMAWMAGLFSNRIEPGQADARPRPVDGQVLALAARREPIVEQAVGSVRARDETLVSSRITARIASVAVRAGDRVSRGDLLIRLDDAELQARLAQRLDEVDQAAAAVARGAADDG